jgi:uncharacterized protein (DUF1015 family)
MRFRAFQALRPQPELAAEVASLPYDVVNTEEVRALVEGNPLSFLRVVRAEGEMSPEVDPYSPEVYARAAANFARLQEEGILLREAERSLYVYQQRMGAHSQRGIVGLCHIDDYEHNVIKKHEKTRQKKEDDRTNLNRALSAHPGPVFLTFEARESLRTVVAETCAGVPLYDFAAPDGVRHTVWKIANPAAVVAEFACIPVAYVADGHHRSASAWRVGKERREANPDHTGEEDYNWFLAVSFPHDELQILPYNRVVKDLNGYTKEALLSVLSELGTLAPALEPTPATVGEICFYVGGQWFKLTLPPLETEDVIARLDVSRLQDLILDPLLAVGDPRTSERVDFIGGIRGTAELEKLVDSEAWAIAFSLYPVTIRQLMDIADADSIMPPKSTWFEPKLRSGLLVNTF